MITPLATFTDISSPGSGPISGLYSTHLYPYGMYRELNIFRRSLRSERFITTSLANKQYLLISAIFPGMLLPYADDKINVTQALHHHGEEPERPGYTLQELLKLSRGTVLQQRILALTTLANILDKVIGGIQHISFL